MNRPANSFLRSLTDSTFARLSEHLKVVELERGVEVHRSRDPVEWVYFPTSAVISMIAADRGALTAETGMVGREGASGLIEALGSSQSSVDGVAQVDGAAFRCSGKTVREIAATDESFSGAAWRLAELQLGESRISALCQARHQVEQRFPRWLLESYDRSGGRNPLPLTQEFMGAMLGVQRTTVTQYAAHLQQRGLIKYVRGRLELIDVLGLEHSSCDCRAQLKEQRQYLGLSIEALQRAV